jgi:hypothetical protein
MLSGFIGHFFIVHYAILSQEPNDITVKDHRSTRYIIGTFVQRFFLSSEEFL